MLKEWLESSKAIYQMYHILADHKINKTDDSEEFKLILSLLEDAIRFEHKKIEALDFTPETIRKIYSEIATYCDVSTKSINPNIYLDDEEYLSASRIYNIVESINTELTISEYPKQNANIFELIASSSSFEKFKEKKFEEFYITHLTINYIYILSLAERNMVDEKTRSLIIRLMYYTIFLTPSYEENFKTTKIFAKPITIADYVHKLEIIDESIASNYIEDYIIDITNKSIKDILKLNDYDLNYDAIYPIYVKEMVENLARLISLRNANEINKIIIEFERQLEQVTIIKKIRIINDLKYMFESAKRIINDKNKVKKLNYGITNKETN